MDFIKKYALLLLGIVFVVIFFFRFATFQLLPIPSDTIVGLYHPFRDFFSTEYPRGIPFENSQVTDPVRQQYPWRELSISELKDFNLPSWNPYSFTGYPLLANFQSAVFFPGNMIFLLTDFEIGWSLLIMSQPLIAFISMYFFLRNLKLGIVGSFMSSIAFAFCGFFTSWLQWGNVAMTGVFLPLILFSIDKIITHKSKGLIGRSRWPLVLVVVLLTSFFAGHLQTFFYMVLVSSAYILFRTYESKKYGELKSFFVVGLLFLVLSFIQWLPTLRLILLSARDVDQISTAVEGWFVPWQNLTQFIAPDFFGNPATLNYWGVWNYGEFIGYIGILPLIFALNAIIFKRDRNTLFFSSVLFCSILLAFPSIISNLPFKLSIPFISTSQPTRLIYLIDFSLVVLAAFGYEYFREHAKKLVVPVMGIGLLLAVMWGFVIFNNRFSDIFIVTAENLAVTSSNLRLPTIIFLTTASSLLVFIFIKKKYRKIEVGLVFLGIAMVIFLFDIFRFADKYVVFAESKYLYPQTKTIDFIRNQDGKFRVMASDSRILPPNFSSIYRIESVDGYDPLYTIRYAELMAAVGRNEANINPPFGFNRIITPQNYHSELMNILNVRYLLSYGEINNENFIKVFKEGETTVYENKNYIQRVFFVRQTVGAENKYDAIKKIFENKELLADIAIVEGEEEIFPSRDWSVGTAKIEEYDENKVVVHTNNDGEGFLVLTDSYYPTWSATIDGEEATIHMTDYNFRGVVVPGGKHEIIFNDSLY